MNVVIIGGNATGMSAASRLRKNMPDTSIIVLEKGDLVSFGACGLPYFVGDEFSDSQNMVARPLEAFQNNNIDVRLFHEVITLNDSKKTVTAINTETSQEYEFPYDKVLISTGANPIVPPMEGIDLNGVYTLTKMVDGINVKKAVEKAKNVVIVGGGFIGLETAEAMLHLGKNVTLIEMANRISERVFDVEMTEHLQNAVIKHGVNLRLQEKVEAILGDGKVHSVKTNKGEYPADLVIIAIGFSPATKWCDVVEKLPNGAIIIDKLCQTSVNDVYAGGDCATVINAVHGGNSYIPLATSANKLGRLLGDILAGHDISFQGTLGSSALRFKNFEIARTGLSEHEVASLGISYSVNTIKDLNHTNYVPGQQELFLKLIYNTETKVLLGAQICGGEGAVLRINALATAVFVKMTVDTLGMMDFVYAPPFSRTWDIMNIAGNTSK